MYIKIIYEEVRVLQQDGNFYKREIVLLYLIMGYGNYYSTVRIGNKVVMDAIKVTGIIKE